MKKLDGFGEYLSEFKRGIDKVVPGGPPIPKQDPPWQLRPWSESSTAGAGE